MKDSKKVSDLTDREILERTLNNSRTAASDASWVKRYIVVTSIVALILWIIGLTSCANAQSLDSLSSRILALEVENERIKGELWRSHEKFRLGAIIAGTGLALAGFEAITYESDVDGDNIDVRTPIFAYIGGGLMLLGSVIMVDSHRHIGLAGRTKDKPKTWRPFNLRKKKQGK